MNRLILPKLAVLLILVTLIGRLYQLQLVPNEADRFRDSTRARTTRFLPVRPIRGEVFASDGRTVLAESVPIYTVSVRPADLPSRDEQPRERAEVFAQLSQLLGISTTLTISPALALDQDVVLRNDLMQGLGADVVAAARHYEFSPPIRLPLVLGQRADAATLVTRYQPVLEFAAGDASSTVSSTLVLSPATSLQSNQALRDDLAQLVGQSTLDTIGQPQALSWATLTAPPARTLIALQLSDAYSTTVQLDNPVAEHVDSVDIPGYQTLTIKSDIPHDVALVLRENASSLPGVVVDQDYRRRYPLSGELQTLSPLLGFIGRVGECDLVRQNTARSWVGSLLDSIGHAEECGIVRKTIDPGQLGVARYLEDDRIGKDGVEASFEAELRGQMGWEGLLVDAAGQPVRAPQTVQPARDGENLVLTIDVPFQRQVEQILRNWIDMSEQRRLASDGRFAYKRDYKPIRSGVAIVMEVQTGRILAMVSWPSYDNNVWGDPKRAGELSALLDTTNPENRRLTPLLNHAI
ncbi:MAG: peptidoglycan glycosyltransferase, partial [Roseiflexaceae bacterium]